MEEGFPLGLHGHPDGLGALPAGPGDLLAATAAEELPLPPKDVLHLFEPFDREIRLRAAVAARKGLVGPGSGDDLLAAGGAGEAALPPDHLLDAFHALEHEIRFGTAVFAGKGHLLSAHGIASFTRLIRMPRNVS